MSTPRRKWSTTFMGSPVRRRHESQAAAYRQIQEDRRHWVDRAKQRVVVDVWVDERDGHGWRLSERINLADYGVEG